MHFLNDGQHEVSPSFISYILQTPRVKIMTEGDKVTKTLTSLQPYGFTMTLLLPTGSRCLRFRRLLCDIRIGLDPVYIIFGCLKYVTYATALVTCYYSMSIVQLVNVSVVLKSCFTGLRVVLIILPFIVQIHKKLLSVCTCN